MGESTPQNEIATRKVVYEMPAGNAVTIHRDVKFPAADEGMLAMDVYYPPDARPETLPPVVVIIAGYPDAGFRRILGCGFKDMGSTTSWARLIAASGMAAIAYTNVAPVADLHMLLDHIKRDAATLGVDADRIGVWASSGNVPLALSLLMSDSPVRLACAALFYGCMLDLDGTTAIAAAARAFGFVNPCAGKSVADLRPDVPLFLARAGSDQMPGLNDALDRFVAKAVAANLPVTLVNHPSAPHAFDIFDDHDDSRLVVRQALWFLQSHLTRGARS
jgi:fermentation-respiration switch protein FrsA (DUF1100 family)